MRLAFAIAIYVETDILLVDDIFAVGDIYAQRKCINKMFELKEKGKPIIYGTTRKFLEVFNLKDLSELPTLRELKELNQSQENDEYIPSQETIEDIPSS